MRRYCAALTAILLGLSVAQAGEFGADDTSIMKGVELVVVGRLDAFEVGRAQNRQPANQVGFEYTAPAKGKLTISEVVLGELAEDELVFKFEVFWLEANGQRLPPQYAGHPNGMKNVETGDEGLWFLRRKGKRWIARHVLSLTYLQTSCVDFAQVGNAPNAIEQASARIPRERALEHGRCWALLDHALLEAERTLHALSKCSRRSRTTPAALEDARAAVARLRPLAERSWREGLSPIQREGTDEARYVAEVANALEEALRSEEDRLTR